MFKANSAPNIEAEKETPPRPFTSVQIPSGLAGKSLREVQETLRGQYGGKLATMGDLEYVKNHRRQYPNLQDGKRHYAFGSTGKLLSLETISYITFSASYKMFIIEDFPAATQSLESDFILLKA